VNLPRRHERTKALLRGANGPRGHFILILAGVRRRYSYCQ
jgi:hypothetical protein